MIDDDPPSNQAWNVAMVEITASTKEPYRKATKCSLLLPFDPLFHFNQPAQNRNEAKSKDSVSSFLSLTSSSSNNNNSK
jgi:hypothetical protein